MENQGIVMLLQNESITRYTGIIVKGVRECYVRHMDAETYEV